MISVANPPARRTVKEFEIVEVRLRAGALYAVIEARDSAGAVVGTFAMMINAGWGTGVRYTADGGVEGFRKDDASITLAAAFNAFANAAGGFAAKAAALEAWAAAAPRGLVPS